MLIIIYDEIKDLSAEELDINIAALACAQCITNIYEVSQYLTHDDVLERLLVFLLYI